MLCPREAPCRQRLASGLNRVHVFISDFRAWKRCQQSRVARPSEIQNSVVCSTTWNSVTSYCYGLRNQSAGGKTKKHYADPGWLNKQRTRPPFGRGKRGEHVFFCIMINGFLCAGALARACVYLRPPKTRTKRNTRYNTRFGSYMLKKINKVNCFFLPPVSQSHQ